MKRFTEYHAVYSDGDVNTGLTLKEARALMNNPPDTLIEVRKWVRFGDNDEENGEEYEEKRQELILWEKPL